ncbi:lasso peptide biosynthesis B2 protein [Aneurinibacillus aneurinilyticus]|uniref:lasso peptide biosynthesis B2 protein n=1 Tax=Aneurinibacillus aneurinilyticus TaxID=1391 RepID=UPI0023F3BAE0|nr:lasso peptide biosynthesis B2 protein [Aneurinibacillus aneurinilyticus]MED0673561.1 lasso peptide biosynthesis B2 protein [Aneurinibacillus aneurinilyticus]
MKIFRKVKAFLRLNMKMKLLLIEAFVYLAWARYLKSVPFSKVAPLLGERMGETPFSSHSFNKEILRNVSAAIHMMSGYTFWESECLVKAIAGMRMLEKRKIESTLYLGTAKDKHGEFVAHAWLRSGSYYVSGSETMGKFTVVASFAKGCGIKKSEGENHG